MDKKKKNLIIIAISVILVGVLAFVIYWQSTEFERYRKEKILDIQTEIKEYREDEDSYFSVYISDELMEDSLFQDFLVTQVQEMCENCETSLLEDFLSELEYVSYAWMYSTPIQNSFETLVQKLCKNGEWGELYSFLRELEWDDQQYSYLTNAVTDAFMDSGTPEAALEMLDELSWLEYYNSQMILTRDSQVLASYINENGTQPITTTPGEGYYANEEDTSSRKTVGITGSSLYDAKSVTHFGDFKRVEEYGVELNRSTYTERSYSDVYWYFRDCYVAMDSLEELLTFDFDSLENSLEGEFVLSGDYLFVFSFDGVLLDFCKL